MHGAGTPRADVIQEWVQRVDVDHLCAKGYTGLMTESELAEGVTQGATTPGTPSDDRSTEASRQIVACARADADDLLWVLVWGSITDVAQALFEAPDIADRIRIHFIGSSNTENDPGSRDWIYAFMADNPSLWWIENGVMPKRSRDTFRGVRAGWGMGQHFVYRDAYQRQGNDSRRPVRGSLRCRLSRGRISQADAEGRGQSDDALSAFTRVRLDHPEELRSLFYQSVPDLGVQYDAREEELLIEFLFPLLAQHRRDD